MNDLIDSVFEWLWLILSKLIKINDKYVGVSTFPDYDDTLISFVECTDIYRNKLFIIFINKDKKKYNWVIKKNIKVIKKNSIAGIYYYHRCKYIFYTHNLFSKYKKNRNKVIINMWHGLPIKKVGLLNGDKLSNISNFDFIVIDQINYANIFKRVFGINCDKILINKHPRLDQLANNYNLPESSVLWLPTYRSNNDPNEYKVQNDHILLGKINEIFKQKKINCIIKLHPLEKKSSNNKYSNIKIYSDIEFYVKFSSLYRLIGSVKYIITDISSVYFDCLCSNINVILFCKDYDEYSKSRGFISESLDIISKKVIKLDQLFIDEIIKNNSINFELNKYKNNITNELLSKVIK